MTTEELIKAYMSLIGNRDKSGFSHKADEILERGIVVADNDHLNDREGVILLTGINPSFKETDSKGSFRFRFSEASDNKVGRSRYWFNKHRQFGAVSANEKGNLIDCHMAYLDLFPIRERKQNVFEAAFRHNTDFRFQMLQITQKAIHDLHPKLIIHANKGSLYYWGMNNKFQEDNIHPWLDYNFIPVDLHALPFLNEYFNRVRDTSENQQYAHLFKISGNGIRECFFLTYVMEHPYMTTDQRKLLLTPGEMVQLCSWCLK